MAWWWSWLLSGVGAVGMWIVGDRRRYGFVILVGSEALWLAYAFDSGQWGFAPAAVLWAVIYARNWHRWREAP